MDARPPPWWKSLIFLREFWCFWRVRAPQNAENPWNSMFLWEKCKISNISCIFHKNPGNVSFSACLRATPPKHQYSLRNINGFKHVMKPQNHGNRKNHEIPWKSWIFMNFTEIPWNSLKSTFSLLHGSLYAPMAENVDIPKGLLVVPEAP